MNAQLLYKTLITSALGLISFGSFASSYHIMTPGSYVNALARADAGSVAMLDSAAVISQNPALMSFFKSSQFSIEMRGNYYDNFLPAPNKPDILEARRGGAEGVSPHNLFYAAPFSFWSFGIGFEYLPRQDIYNPLNKRTTTLFKSVAGNLSFALPSIFGFSLGVGFNSLIGLANTLTVSKDSKGLLVEGPQDNPQQLVLGGNWNIGLAYEFNENHRIGLAWHSPTTLTPGDEIVHPLLKTAEGFLQRMKNEFMDKVGDKVKDQTGQSIDLNQVSLPDFKLTTSSSHQKIKLPDYIDLGGYHKFEDFALFYSYKYSFWSRAKLIEERDPDGNLIASGKLANSSRFALGFSYDLGPVVLRTGAAYEQGLSGANAERGPGQTWLSFGLSYKIGESSSLDLGYAYGFRRKFDIDGKQAYEQNNWFGLNFTF